MQRTKLFFIILSLLIVSCSSPVKQPAIILEGLNAASVRPPVSELEMQKLDSAISIILKRYKFNGNVLVAFKGYPVFTSTQGFSDFGKKDSLDSNTAFQIASVSKGFTAMAVLMLFERGFLHIDDSVKSHIPEFPFENITIKQLLNHTSGMQNYMYFVDQHWDHNKPINNEDVLSLINEHDPNLNFRPGRRHYYCNTGYAILALLVERVSGQSFHRFLRQNIFDPLDMDNTFVWDSAVIDTITNIATGYTRRGWRYRRYDHNPLDEIVGDKSVYSTVHDLLKWDQALYTNRLLSDTLLQESFLPTVLRRGRTYNYGYGWRLKSEGGKKIIYHNGLWNGFTSSFTRYVDDSLTIILLNNTNSSVGSIAKQVYRKVEHELHMD
nr:beta-lactamase family protein [Bacteroidota bacterium]